MSFPIRIVDDEMTLEDAKKIFQEAEILHVYEERDTATANYWDIYQRNIDLLTQMGNLIRRTQNQRHQIRNLQEKLAAMKTWRGIFRTIGQRLGVCR